MADTRIPTWPEDMRYRGRRTAGKDEGLAAEQSTRTSPIGVMVRYDNGVIVHTLSSGALVDTDAAHTVLEITADLAAGDRVATVIDMRSIAFADRDAREVFARDPSGGVEVATALVIAPKVASFLASQFVRGARPERPIAMFETVEEAMGWAADQVAAAP